MTVLANQLKHAVGLTLNVKRRKVFWTDLRDERIDSVSMDNLTSVQTVLSDNEVRSPISLALDWVNDHLYWVDFSLGTVSVAYSNGSWPTTLKTMEGMSIRSVALHPEKGYMFLTAAKSRQWLIMRCSMDGNDCVDIVKENIKEPTTLAIDYSEHRLFWADAKLNMISSSDFDGSNQKIVLSVYNYLQHPFGIAICMNEVYWTDVRAHRVLKSNKWTGETTSRSSTNIYISPMEIQIDHPSTQPNMMNHCHDHPCQYMCIPLPVGGVGRYRCVCPDGYVEQGGCVKVGKPTDSTNQINNPNTQHSDVQTLAPTTTTTTASTIATAVVGMSSGTKILIGVTVVGILVLLFFIACGALRWYQRRSLQLSMHFDNPVYRKTTTHGNEEDDHRVGIPRSGSQAHLISNEEFDDPERNEEVSVDVIVGNGRPQNTYRPLRQMSMEDTISQNSLGTSDIRNLVS
uniref:low-density lipoprotein receptor isoform X2 n=1 Tax=Ciona intestinalis TaxID=7719 RepID=UPI0002B8E3A1|nr:low-density lipoprotein receptor isoform X2 [Ciona intestinalis]|eukprot:XP_018668645.1 low-density lipoprotein receptor isoform X2 [Ciona intestinalis]